MTQPLINRRRFLQTTSLLAAAGAVAPLWIPSSRTLADDQKSPNSRLRLGCIGTGDRWDADGPAAMKFATCVAVCDVDANHAEKGKKVANENNMKYGQKADVDVYEDYQKILERKDIDVVTIVTPDHWHSKIAIEAMQAGKDIYCEKPLTHNVAEGRALVDAVAKSKVVFQTGSQQRSEFNNHFRKAVEFIWNGRIGKLKSIHIGVGEPSRPCDLPKQEIPAGTDWDFWQGPAPERDYHSDLCPKGVHGHFPAWRMYSEYAGGQVADMGAHHFDIAQWAMEMDSSGPVEVIPPSDQPGAKRGLKLVYASGIEMIHNEFPKGKDGKEIKGDCVFVGADGIIVASRDGIRSIDPEILKAPLDAKARRVMASSDHKANWLDAIQSPKLGTICTAETGHRSASICHLVNIGYRLHRKLKWDPAKELFIGDEPANKELRRTPRDKWKA